MKISHETISDEYPNLIRTLRGLNGKTIDVGAFEGEHAWLVGIHEYGCKIKVTPKMRAWFAYQGYPLKKTTTEITIPERSFIRAGHDQYSEEVLKEAESVIDDVLVGTMSVERYCELIGMLMSERIKDFATDLKNPPNSGMTADRKGSSNPLVDTGHMIQSITYEVK